MTAVTTNSEFEVNNAINNFNNNIITDYSIQNQINSNNTVEEKESEISQSSATTPNTKNTQNTTNATNTNPNQTTTIESTNDTNDTNITESNAKNTINNTKNTKNITNTNNNTNNTPNTNKNTQNSVENTTNTINNNNNTNISLQNTPNTVRTPKTYENDTKQQTDPSHTTEDHKQDHKEEKQLQNDSKLNENPHKLSIPSNLHLLTWNDIKFKDSDEKQGAMNLQQILHKDSNIPINKLPPFEITRYYIGSFYDIKLATRRWLDSIDMYKDHKFDTISDSDLELYLTKISNVMQIGGINDRNELVCSLACKCYIASDFTLNSTFIKAYYMVLHLLTSDLNILRNGVILIGSAENYSTKNFTYQLVTRFALFQKVYPIRLARIFVINGSTFVQTCFNIIKPLLSKFMQQRIFWMQYNVFKEEKRVDKELMPDNILDGEFKSKEVNPLVRMCMEFHRRNNDLRHFKMDKESYSKIKRK